MLKREDRDSIAWLMFDRPEKRNAIPQAFWPEFASILEDIASDESVRVAVLHGNGSCFSVGADIADFGDIGRDTRSRLNYMRTASKAFRLIDELPKPVIAAVHGYALGGGCELSIVCDVVIADETASFGLPEVGVGLIPGPGIVRGPAQINSHWMRYMVLSGLPIDANQAHIAGLVNFVTPAGEHLAEAERIAVTMTQRSALAQAVGKAFLSSGGWERQEFAAETCALLQHADDFAEGIAAFKEKRPPQFA